MPQEAQVAVERHDDAGDRARHGPAHADHLRRAAVGHDQGVQPFDRRGDGPGHQRRRRMRRGDGRQDRLPRRLRMQQAGRGDEGHLLPGGEAEAEAPLRGRPGRALRQMQGEAGLAIGAAMRGAGEFLR